MDLSERRQELWHGLLKVVMNNLGLGTMITPGSRDDHSSFHSELAEIYGVLITLEALNIDTGWKCPIACSGKSCLDQIQSTYPILPTEPHADILLAVKNKVSQLGVLIDWNHVKGHQDGKLITVLPRDTWLNIETYLLAKDKVNLTYTGPTTYHLPGEGWICFVGTKQIVKQLAQTICDHVNGIPAVKYWKTIFCLSETLWNSIDWQALGQAFSKSSTPMQHWAIKHTSSFFAHGKIWLDGNFDQL